MAKDSRQKALDTARKLFIKKGKDGVRMQEIADVAGLNKGLLHYYFKSKDNLFQEIFRNEFLSLFGTINDLLKANVEMDVKLGSIIDHLFDKGASEENYASFISFECDRNKKLVGQLETEANFGMSVELLNTEFRNNRISSSSEFSLQVMLNILSLCSYPFSMKGLVDKVNGKSNWNAFLEERKAFLKTIIIGSFRP
jgi:TetR/AcrR family transcriptional regulator